MERAAVGKNPPMPALAPDQVEMADAWVEGDEVEVQPDGSRERKPVS